MSGAEKEDFENYMEDLTVVFKLNLFADGTYFRNMPGYSDDGKWRLINGETGLELFSNKSEYSSAFDIKEYNNPRLTISMMKNGDQQLFLLVRAENQSSCSAKNLSDSMAAIQPVPAAVTA